MLLHLEQQPFVFILLNKKVIYVIHVFNQLLFVFLYLCRVRIMPRACVDATEAQVYSYILVSFTKSCCFQSGFREFESVSVFELNNFFTT